MPTPEARLATILDHATAADPAGVLLYFHTPAEAEAFLADYTRSACQRGADMPNRRRPDDPPIVLSDASGCAESPPQTGGGAGERARALGLTIAADWMANSTDRHDYRQLAAVVEKHAIAALRSSHREGEDALQRVADALGVDGISNDGLSVFVDGPGDREVAKYVEHIKETAHREGADAMRESCAKYAENQYHMNSFHIAIGIRALPIPGKTDAG